MQQSFIFFLTFTLLLKKSNGDGTVSVFLSYYDNARGLTYHKKCCEGRGWCSTCDHYFIVCLDKSSGSPAYIHQCRFGQFTTGVIRNQNEITFGNTIGNTPNPKELHFDRWLGSVLFKVQVWHNGNYRNTFVDQLTTTVTLNTSRSRAEKRQESFTVRNRTQLDFKMAVFCDENWYGPHCDIYCEPDRENYQCGYHNGEYVCHPGWKGENCIRNTTKCGGGYCFKPGGTCVDNHYGNCECWPGYKGQKCYYEINECASNPCHNNGTCVDKIDEFQCRCPHGFAGSTCEVETDACEPSPCENGATCLNFISQFHCQCSNGFTGPTCGNNIDECASYPCDNNGTCMDGIGQFHCLCPCGYTGPTCTLDVDECESQPCKNNATCTNLVGQFQCLCPNRYTGTTCNNEETGSYGSQTRNVTGITVAVVIIVLAMTLLIIWKVYQKRQVQQNETQNEDYGLSHEEATMYYIAQPDQQQQITDENLSQNSTGGDTQSTDTVLYDNSVYGTGPADVYGNASVVHLHETQADAENDTLIIDNPVYGTGASNMHTSTQLNTRSNTSNGGKTKSNDEVDTVEYANAICVKNTGDVYAVVSK